MTGPEHYAEAERLIGAIHGENVIVTSHPHVIAAAQVHATLALAAATAVNDFQAWCDVAVSPDEDKAEPW